MKLDLGVRIAIIGAGPTGITLSKSLVSKGFYVDLIEAGGVTSENADLTRDNYHFESISLMPGNVHRLGGGSNYWIARIGEFLPIDFRPLEGVRDESFPFSYEEIKPYYGEVFQMLTGERIFDSALVESESLRLGIVLPPNLELRIIRYAEKTFFNQAIQDLSQDPRFELLLNQRVFEIRKLHKDGVEAYTLESRLNGTSVSETYDVVILCCGAMQSPSLILSSPDLLNAHTPSIAGRFLMEHFDGFGGDICWSRKKHSRILKTILLNRNRETRKSDGLGVAIKISESLRSENKTINLQIEVIPKQRHYLFDPARRSGWVSMFKLFYFLERVARKLVGQTLNSVLAIFGKATYSFWVKGEIIPNPDSVVYVSGTGPSLKTHYDHQVSQKSKFELIRALKSLGEELSLAGIGDLRIKPSILNGTDTLLSGYNWHPMGTLRMGLEEDKSVCDQNLRLHTSKNVYVADASVFPSGSNANPTFTALALGVRLSSYLQERFSNNASV